VDVIPSELEELIVKSCALRLARETQMDKCFIEDLELEVSEIHALIDPLEAMIIE
jgi:hypothetical protein